MLDIIPTPEPLFSKFNDLGIETVTYAHPPVFTVEEGADFKHLIPGGHTKNLFLKDKKDQLWLVTALWDTVIDLKTLPPKINAARLSFGSADRLMQALGVIPGSVTPLALINDKEMKVRPVLDERLFSCDVANCHPLRNDRTTSVRPADLVTFMKDMGYNPLVIDFTTI